MAGAIRRHWWILAAPVGIGIGMLIDATPAGPTIMRLLPPAGVAILAVLCFRYWLRQDRVAFLSVIGPAFVVAVASTFTRPPWWSLTGVIPLLFLALFIFDTPVRVWWWRYVLRRPLPTAAQTSDYRLVTAVRAWSEALQGRDGPFGTRFDAGQRAIQTIRDLELPDPDWSVLRDSYVDATERWTALARIGPEAEGWPSINDEFVALGARCVELRQRN